MLINREATVRREDLRDLMNLLAVVEEGSFTKAAAKLGLSQSALSHAVRRLEQRVGVRVLARTTRSLALTQAGERLVESVRPALAEIAGALDALARSHAQPTGALRISASEHAARTALWTRRRAEPRARRLVRAVRRLSPLFSEPAAATAGARAADRGVALARAMSGGPAP